MNAAKGSRFLLAAVLSASLAASGCWGHGRYRGDGPLAWLGAVIITAAVVSALAPPPPRVVYVPPPRPGYAWQPGYWTREGDDWVWVDGQWVQLPPHYAWQPTHWEQAPDGTWRLVPGRWEPAP